MTSNLVNKNPYEAWAGKRPSLAHLRVFGCAASMHLPKEIRNKLDSELEKCIFVRYKDRVKGYKLWNPTTRNTMYSRDAIFREVSSTSETEEVRERKLEKLEFNWNDESHDSDESTEFEEEVENQTAVVRRSRQRRKQSNMYSTPNFHSAFALSTIEEEDPRMVKGAIESKEDELWKKAMEEEMESLRKK